MEDWYKFYQIECQSEVAHLGSLQRQTDFSEVKVLFNIVDIQLSVFNDVEVVYINHDLSQDRNNPCKPPGP